MQIMPSNNNSSNNENAATRGAGGVTPVGVTIARSKRSRRKSLKKEELKPKKKSTNSSATTTANVSSNNSPTTQRSTGASLSSSSSYQKPVSSWSIFWEGSAVYAACLIIPTVMAYIVRHHEYQISMQQQHQQAASGAAEEQPSLTLLSTTVDLVYSLAMEYIWTEPVSATASYYLCPAENGPFVYYLGADYMPTWFWCPKPPEQEVVLMSPDAAWTDLNVVILISFTLALIRLIIVRIVLGGSTSNFLNDSTRMHAMLKCKSTHLLSRDYHLTPCGTPVLVKPRKVLQPHEIATAMAAAAAAANTSPTGAAAAATSTQRSSFSLFPSRGASLTGALVPPNMNEDNDDHDDDDNALDDNDDYVIVGLLLDDASDHDGPSVAPAPRPSTTTTSASSFIFPPAPPLSRGEPVVRPQQQQQQQPDSPLEYLTDASIRRCNSTSSGLGGGHRSFSSSSSIIKGSSSSQRLISPMNLVSSSSSIRVAPTSSRPAPERLYAAPRLATAVFRLAYTTVSVVLAWHSFYTADFWPWYVGGGMVGRAGRRAGSTMHVWDLNGGVSVGILDSDFDLRNTVLRRYFLVQASYHFHSTAFHVLSMIIFLIQNYRSKNNEKKENSATAATSSASANPQSPSSTSLSSLVNPTSSPVSSSSPSSSYGIWKVSTTSYLRSLLHHTLALLTYATAYIFSSLRRLVAIGMFAFDVSSLFLHLLQIFVNAKNDNNNNNNSRNEEDKDGTSRWQKLLTARRIQYFYLYFVLPSFVYCRFGVWGALWLSAWTESGLWLQQLEKTLFPNAALILQSLWNVCMAGLFVANLIYLHRLLHHPHLKRICLRENY